MVVFSKYFLNRPCGYIDCFDHMLSIIGSENREYELVFDFCRAVAKRGRLCDVPKILNAYEKFLYVKDSDILCKESGPISDGVVKCIADGFSKYEALFMKKYTSIATQYEDDRVLLKNSQQRTFARFLKSIITSYNTPHFSPKSFCIMTGEDKTQFYEGKKFHPIRVARLAEKLLANPLPRISLNENRNYFFWHPV